MLINIVYFLILCILIFVVFVALKAVNRGVIAKKKYKKNIKKTKTQLN